MTAAARAHGAIEPPILPYFEAVMFSAPAGIAQAEASQRN
jgi:hypothetical protein